MSNRNGNNLENGNFDKLEYRNYHAQLFIGLAQLPVELLHQISSYLSNSDLLRLGLAWKHFLRMFAHPLDPQNPLRITLREAWEADPCSLHNMLLLCLFGNPGPGRTFSDEISPETTLVQFWEESRVRALAQLFGSAKGSVVQVRPLSVRIAYREDLPPFAMSRKSRIPVIPDFPFRIRIALFDEQIPVMARTCIRLVAETDWVRAMDTYLPPKGTKQLAEALATNTSLRSLYLAGERKLKPLEALAAAIERNAHLEEVAIGSDPDEEMDTTRSSTAFLCSLFRSPSVKRLKLSSLDFDVKLDRLVLVPAIVENTKLTGLTLNFCFLGKAATQLLADALRSNTTLCTIRLHHCVFGKQLGIVPIANALLTNRAITRLQISGHTFSPKDRLALEGLVRITTSLRYLEFQSCQMEQPHINALLEAFLANDAILSVVAAPNLTLARLKDVEIMLQMLGQAGYSKERVGRGHYRFFKSALHPENQGENQIREFTLEPPYHMVDASKPVLERLDSWQLSE